MSRDIIKVIREAQTLLHGVGTSEARALVDEFDRHISALRALPVLSEQQAARLQVLFPEEA